MFLLLLLVLFKKGENPCTESRTQIGTERESKQGKLFFRFESRYLFYFAFYQSAGYLTTDVKEPMKETSWLSFQHISKI